MTFSISAKSTYNPLIDTKCYADFGDKELKEIEGSIYEKYFISDWEGELTEEGLIVKQAILDGISPSNMQLEGQIKKRRNAQVQVRRIVIDPFYIKCLERLEDKVKVDDYVSDQKYIREASDEMLLELEDAADAKVNWRDPVDICPTSTNARKELDLIHREMEAREFNTLALEEYNKKGFIEFNPDDVEIEQRSCLNPLIERFDYTDFTFNERRPFIETEYYRFFIDNHFEKLSPAEQFVKDAISSGISPSSMKVWGDSVSAKLVQKCINKLITDPYYQRKLNQLERRFPNKSKCPWPHVEQATDVELIAMLDKTEKLMEKEESGSSPTMVYRGERDIMLKELEYRANNAEYLEQLGG